MERLQAAKCSVTQATLSRDLKTLRTSKVATEIGSYRYVIGANGMATDEVASRATDSVRQAAIQSVAFSGRQAVIRTRNGYAGGVAYDIDELEEPHILGTVAGADTVFVAVDNDVTPAEVFTILSQILPASVMERGRKYFM